MRQRRRWRLDTLFGRNFQSAFQGELNLARSFFARVPVRHDARPFDDLGNEAFVAFSAEYQMRISYSRGSGCNELLHHEQSSSRRGAETSTRGACAPQSLHAVGPKVDG
jgi:hypothetical protein